jgi:hypothetical protein
MKRRWFAGGLIVGAGAAVVAVAWLIGVAHQRGTLRYDPDGLPRVEGE